MQDLTDRLGRLYNDMDARVSDDTVAADLRRGRRALRLRRARRIGYTAGGVLAAVTAGTLAYTAADGGGASSPAPGSGHSVVAAGQIRLVAYDGAQRPGFVVEQVPEGYVLQGVSGSVLDIAPSGNHTSLNDLVGKLVVSVDNDTAATGTPVQVGDVVGHYRKGDDGVQTLTFKDGDNLVNVQAWSNIEISRDQLATFAEGITVTKDVQLSHG